MEIWKFPKDAEEFSKLTELTAVTYEGVSLKEGYCVWLTTDTFSPEGVEDTEVGFTLILGHRTIEGAPSTWIQLVLEDGRESFSPRPFLHGKTVDLCSFMYPPTRGGYDNCWLGSLLELIAVKEVKSVTVSYNPKELAEALQVYIHVYVRVQVGEMTFVGISDLEEASNSLELTKG